MTKKQQSTPAEVEAEQIVQVDPGTLVIGANVRVDTHPDAAEFAESIRERGVLEVITASRDEDGNLVVLRGQRRAVVAAQVGTPTGTVPVRVIPATADDDRIIDQMAENLHRARMHDHEIAEAVAQLALIGVSAADIARKTALSSDQVDGALRATQAPTARARLHDGFSLEEAAIYAEFEGDPDAIHELDKTITERGSLDFCAEQLRQDQEARLARRALIDQRRAEGLPVLDPADTPNYVQPASQCYVHADTGEEVTDDEVPTLPGAALAIMVHDTGTYWTSNDEDEDADEGPSYELQEIWTVQDPAAAGLVPAWKYWSTHRSSTSDAQDAADAEAERDRKREQRRRTIANNKAWTAATEVRRAWLERFAQRKTPPKGAEQLIAACLLPPLRSRVADQMHREHGLFTQWVPHLDQDLASPKRAQVIALVALLAMWEYSLSRDTWRQPSAWDARMMGALIEWGYQASDVERLLIGQQPDTATETAA